MNATSMQEALAVLKQRVGQFSEARAHVDEETFRAFQDNCIVALAAGGEGSRLKALTGSEGVHKTVLTLPNGQTMIERTICMYRGAGFRRFVALVFHEAQSVKDEMGDGSKLGVEITYSHDPKQPVGRGGAIRNALDNGSIPEDFHLIVHNPDDQIVKDVLEFPNQIVAAHLSSRAVATAVVVEGTPYPYSGMSVKEGMVTGMEMYPVIPIPTHIGVTVFSSTVYPYFKSLFDLSKKVDFEKLLFPILCNEHKLAATAIPPDAWIPVNDPKSWQTLLTVLGTQDSTSSS